MSRDWSSLRSWRSRTSRIVRRKKTRSVATDATTTVVDADQNAIIIVADRTVTRDATIIVADRIVTSGATMIATDRIVIRDVTITVADRTVTRDATIIVTGRIVTRDATIIVADRIASSDVTITAETVNLGVITVTNALPEDAAVMRIRQSI